MPTGWDQLSEREREVYALRHSTDPMLPLREVATRMGLSVNTVRAAWQSAQEKTAAPPPTSAPDAGVLERVPKDAMVRWTEHNMLQLLRAAATPERLAKASVRDISQAIKDHHVVRAQLLGEPTHVVAIDSRRTLNEVILSIAAEARRRGVALPEFATVDTTASPLP